MKLRTLGTCKTNGCTEPAIAKDLCENHYANLMYKRHAKRIRKARKKYYYSRPKPQRMLCSRDYMLRKWFDIPQKRKGGPKNFAGIEEYNRRFEAQGCVCAMCHLPPKPPRNLVVDHNHETGALRGLLCDICNRRVLGILEHYRKRLSLNDITSYLEKYDSENALLRTRENNNSNRTEVLPANGGENKLDSNLGLGSNGPKGGLQQPSSDFDQTVRQGGQDVHSQEAGGR